MGCTSLWTRAPASHGIAYAPCTFPNISKSTEAYFAPPVSAAFEDITRRRTRTVTTRNTQQKLKFSPSMDGLRWPSLQNVTEESVMTTLVSQVTARFLTLSVGYIRRLYYYVVS